MQPPLSSCQQHRPSFPRNLKQDIFFPKLDYQLNGKNHLSAQLPLGGLPSAQRLQHSLLPPTTASVRRTEQRTSTSASSWRTGRPSRLQTPVNAFHFQWSRDLETDTANAPGPAVKLSHGIIDLMASPLPCRAGPSPTSTAGRSAESTRLARPAYLQAGVDHQLHPRAARNLFQGNGNYSLLGGQRSSQLRPLGPGRLRSQWSPPLLELHSGLRSHHPHRRDDFWNKNLAGFAEDAGRSS